MPQTYTYPGVYIEELPSGVHTITGVATSITAFVGWAPQGPTDDAVRVLSWQDYERTFGGLDSRTLLGYAVYHFFNNGGQQAYVVRIAAADAKFAALSIGDLKLTATGPGAWANTYGVLVQKREDADGEGRFGLTVVRKNIKSPQPEVLEVYKNLSMKSDDPRFVESVINEESRIINAKVEGDAIEATGPNEPNMLGDGKDGEVLSPNSAAFETALQASGSGYSLLERIDLFNLLCIPGETTETVISELEAFCRSHRAMLIVDCEEEASFTTLSSGPPSTITGDDSINAAFYFPWLKAPDPTQQNRLRAFPPSGFVAGLYAKTDTQRGVWKAPAGTEASLTGVSGVTQRLTDRENGVLNIQAINCIRAFNVYGTVIWGARTLQGNDERGSEWKYVPVRRTALFIEETLYRSLKWVVFEPNDEPLWAQIRLNVGAFMHDLFRQGAFQGQTPREAYSVRCDKDTTTQSDINRGIVNILVGFAPLKPAEFVIVKLQQIAGQIQV